MYDPEQAGLAALFALLDAKDKLAPPPAPATTKEIADYPVLVAPGFCDE